MIIEVFPWHYTAQATVGLGRKNLTQLTGIFTFEIQYNIKMRYPLNFNQRTMDFEDDIPSAPNYHQSNQLQYGVYPKPVASPSCPTLSKDTSSTPKKRQSCPSTTSCCLWFSLVISLMVSVILLVCIWMGLFVSETSCETTQPPPPPVVVNTTTTTVIFTPCGSATLPFWKKPIRGKGHPQPDQR